MSIVYDEAQKTITLNTKNTTYQMQIDRYGFLLHLYYGKRADGCMDYLLTYYDRGFSGNPVPQRIQCSFGDSVLLDRRINLDVLNELGSRAFGDGAILKKA